MSHILQSSRLASILGTNSDSSIVCFPKISSTTYLVLSNSTALIYYSSKVRLSFISPISASLQVRPEFNLSLNIPTRTILLYPVRSFQVQKFSQ